MNSRTMRVLLALTAILAFSAFGFAQDAFETPAATDTVQTAPVQHTSEADLVLPDLGSVQFFGMGGDKLLMGGLLICVLGLLFGVVMYAQLKNLPVHESMREISELIYETCKTY